MDPPDPHTGHSSRAGAETPKSDGRVETSWLEEIVDRLEDDPGECVAAIESLSAVEEETRIHVIEALAPLQGRPVVRDLLRLAAASHDPVLQTAADRVLWPLDSRPSEKSAGLVPARVAAGAGGIQRRPGWSDAPIVRSLVTAIDGEGRGTIVLSVSEGGYRRTAAFCCDVRRGIRDAVGEVEEEHPSAGRLVDEWVRRARGECIIESPELAVRLLEGCQFIGGAIPSGPVRTWLEATVGRPDPPAGVGSTLPGVEPEVIPEKELVVYANRILDACPSWLDRSPLTLGLAEEIALREGRVAPDPVRDAGAYRYLFEHLLIGRLELYGRMLLWMGWLWKADGRPDLARSAFALGAQLSDEQYAIPSHPFAIALTTRSLQAAQAMLGGAGGS